MKKLNKKGFTLVEIMIVVAIIALLAAIAIPNLLRARINSNDALAQSTVRTLSTAAESFATANNGLYPANVAAMMTGVSDPPYINADYCAAGTSGYGYDCTGMSTTGYTFIATPTSAQISGSSVYTMNTGGVLTSILAP